MLNSVEVRRRYEKKLVERKYADLNRSETTERQRSAIFTDIAMSMNTLSRLAEEEHDIRTLYGGSAHNAQDGGNNNNSLFWNQFYIDRRGLLRIL